MRAGPAALRAAAWCGACCAWVSEAGRKPGLISAAGRFDGARSWLCPGRPGFAAAFFFSSALFAAIFLSAVVVEVFAVTGLGGGGGSVGSPALGALWPSPPRTGAGRGSPATLCCAVLSAAFGSGSRTSTGALRAAPPSAAKSGTGDFFSWCSLTCACCAFWRSASWWLRSASR